MTSYTSSPLSWEGETSLCRCRKSLGYSGWLDDKRTEAAIAKRLCAGCSESGFRVGSIIVVDYSLQTYGGDVIHYLNLDCVSKVEGSLMLVLCSTMLSVDYCLITDAN